MILEESIFVIRLLKTSVKILQKIKTCGLSHEYRVALRKSLYSYVKNNIRNRAYVVSRVKDYKTLYQTMQSRKIISFDLYDTLITRCVDSPNDVFLLVAILEGIPDFVAKRIGAEKEAQKVFCRDVTLDDIYR